MRHLGATAKGSDARRRPAGGGCASTPGRTLSSRAATDALLGELRSGAWRPVAWTRFLIGAGRRSVEQARLHPSALGEVTGLHAIALVVGHGSRWRWVGSSWLLCVTHLGMLEHRSHLGVANAITLARANLPVAGHALGAWVAPIAAVTDFVDGRLARRTATSTPFGSYADAVADAAFWTWFVFTRDDSRVLRAAVVLTWFGPIAAVTAVSLRRGHMVESPRPRWIRPAAALQVLFGIRALRRRDGGNAQPELV